MESDGHSEYISSQTIPYAKSNSHRLVGLWNTCFV